MARNLFAFIWVAGLLWAGSAARAEPASELARQALSLYAKTERAPRGDDLLALVRKAPDPWRAALIELDGAGRLPGRAYGDLARALIFVSPTPEGLNAAARLLARAPFADFDRSEWLHLCQKIGQLGADAMPCARRLLDERSFRLPMLGGVDALGKDYALVFLLSQLPEQAWNRELGDRLWIGADSDSSQVALLTALSYAVSLRSDAILGLYVDDASRPEVARARAVALLEQMSSMESAAREPGLSAARRLVGSPDGASEEDLRAARRRALSQVSRKALLDLERLTYLIRAGAGARWRAEGRGPSP